jgi:hypothetical protein
MVRFGASRTIRGARVARLVHRQQVFVGAVAVCVGASRFVSVYVCADDFPQLPESPIHILKSKIKVLPSVCQSPGLLFLVSSLAQLLSVPVI